jgi:hypothetical protein
LSLTDAWKIPTVTRACAACQRTLQTGDLVTTLFRLQAEGPERRDLCSECGQAGENLADAFFWKHRLSASDVRRPVVDYALLRELFARMLQRGDEIYRRLSYLVALVLIRKRWLRLHGFEVRAGREVMVVSRGAGEPHFDVPAPFLSAEDMLAVREHLARLLQADVVEGDLPDLQPAELKTSANPAESPAEAQAEAPAEPAG